MTGEADLAAIGTLLADRTRATILLTLLNGGLTPASALATRAGVSRSLASMHLSKLVEGGIILLAPSRPVSSLRAANERDDLRRARLCYDHLAGRAGVVITEQLVAGGLLTTGYDVTPAGRVAFGRLDIDLDELAGRSRPLTRACLDWSEQRHHLAGSLGAALSGELIRRGWLATREASRVVSVTPAGRTALHERLGVDPGLLELPEAVAA